MNNAFSLRRLEMSMPYLKAAEANEPKALVNLAAIALADEQSLKLIAAGSAETLSIFIEKAYDMPSDEVAETLRNFIAGSARFTMSLNGFKPEEIQQIVTRQQTKLRVDAGLALLED